MRHERIVGLYAIASYQQPAGKARLRFVEPVARGGLRNLRHQRIGILDVIQLFALGVMSLSWIGVIAALIWAKKLQALIVSESQRGYISSH